MGKETKAKMKSVPVECSECGAIVAVMVEGTACDIPCPAQLENAVYEIPEYCKNK